MKRLPARSPSARSCLHPVLLRPRPRERACSPRPLWHPRRLRLAHPAQWAPHHRVIPLRATTRAPRSLAGRARPGSRMPSAPPPPLCPPFLPPAPAAALCAPCAPSSPCASAASGARAQTRRTPRARAAPRTATPCLRRVGRAPRAAWRTPAQPHEAVPASARSPGHECSVGMHPRTLPVSSKMV